ncbi:MAG: glutathione S-transferase family protein [Myxococcota bacterium]|nr:glutathione S-transferase family protein [Myxococcales bacterium]
MKLHTFPLAPNPTKVEVFLKEKGLDLAREIVVLPKGEQHDPAFLARNPLGRVPVLELDDGEFVAESLPILEYLEELHPEPSMIGRTPLERLRIRSLERMIDTSILLPVGRLVHSTRSPLPGVEPNEGMAAWARTALVKPLALLDERVGDAPFVFGDRPTIADGTLFAAMRFGRMFGVEVDASHRNLHRWYASFEERHGGAPRV